MHDTTMATLARRWAVIAAGLLPAAVAADPAALETVAQRVAERLQGEGSAAVVVLIEPDGRRFVRPIGVEREGGAAVGDDTRFQVGSVTKAMVGSLLARLAARGAIGLEDPLSRWVPELAGRPAGAIRLRELATHTSGLPRVPMGLATLWALLRDPRDPYAHLEVGDLLAWLQGWDGAPAGGFEYSNLGYATLGLALERAFGRPLEALLREHVLAPAGAPDAPMDVAGAEAGPHAQGHRAGGRPTPRWNTSTFAAAGGLEASAREMAALLDAARLAKPPFDAGAARRLASRAPDPSAGLGVGLGWLRTERHGDRIVWHDGGTGGFRAFAGYSEVSGRAVVLLAGALIELGDLGRALLNPAFGMPAHETRVRAPLGPAAWLALLLPLAGLWRVGAMAWRATPPRPSRWRAPPASGSEVVLALAGVVMVFVFIVQIGDWRPWTWAGVPLWVPLAAALGIAGAAALRRWRTLPLRPPDRAARRRLWAEGLNLAIALALVALVL